MAPLVPRLTAPTRHRERGRWPGLISFLLFEFDAGPVGERQPPVTRAEATNRAVLKRDGGESRTSSPNEVIYFQEFLLSQIFISAPPVSSGLQEEQSI